MSSVEGLLLSVEKSVLPTRIKKLSSAGNGSGFWDVLFSNFNYNFEAVYTVIDAILTVKDRCQMTSLYIQAIVLNDVRFLVSNTHGQPDFKVSPVSTSWLLGSSPTCAVPIADQSVDGCHSVIGYSPTEGYHVTDLGSHQGTRLNRRLLPVNQRRTLRNGDMLELGSRLIEFFIDDFDQLSAGVDDSDITYY